VLRCPLCAETLSSPYRWVPQWNVNLGEGLKHYGGRIKFCGHMFCLACLIRWFDTAEPGQPWMTRCPQCNDYILSPPKPDERTQTAVTYLQLAQGDQTSDALPPVIHPTPSTAQNPFRVYFYMS
jgi:hypothetical protein